MFEDLLQDLKDKGLLRRIIDRSSMQGPVITVDGRRYINFASNDYLGLASHPKIISAATKAAQKYGFGAGASRLLAGGSVLHRRLEKEVAGFKGAEEAVFFNSGYAANTGIIPALTSEKDVIFSDELNHASIIDGCRLSNARAVIYRHKDTGHLEELLRKTKAEKKIVITDSVFSMDGDIADLPGLSEICRRHKSIFYIDDAHGTGVLGNGIGALAHFKIRPEPWIIQMGTFSKALGSFGAFVAGSTDTIEWIRNSARSLIFSTALPPPVAAASIAALKILSGKNRLVSSLWGNRERLVNVLNRTGWDTMGSETPIIPVRVGDIPETVSLSSYLWKNGIYAPAIRPPTVKEPRIRLTVTAVHTERHLDKLINVLTEYRRSYLSNIERSRD